MIDEKTLPGNVFFVFPEGFLALQSFSSIISDLLL